MDTAQWPQQGIVGVVKRSVESNQRVLRPHKDQALLNCPRCNSTNTKFCYYNNYSLSQPRYFCKTCRRYWTEGGSLRNVPVGGGSRKNKRSSSSSSSSSSSNPTLPNSSSSTNLRPCERMNVNHGGLGSSKLCQGGFMGPFGEAGQLFGAGFAGFQEMMRSGASIGGYGGRMEGEEGDGRLLFHFQDLKQGNVSNGGGHGGQGDPTTLFWNGVMGSGGGGGGVNGGGGGGGAW